MNFFIKTKLLQTKIEMLETEYHIDVLDHLRMAKTVKYNCLLSACCFKNDDEFNVELLKKISEIFGLTDEEFLGADGNKAFKYRNKYSEFFELYDEYCKKIYEVSKNAPRESEVVISFNRISELILCFSELFNNYKKLFYKLLQGDLSTDERHEFDFLAHFLEMKDILISENFLTYKVVRKRRKLYLEEIKNYKLNSIIYSERLFNFHPWNCLEFGDEKSAVSELDKINVFWIQEFRDMIINLENGRKFHFCLENEFDINYIPVKKYLDFGPVDDDFSDDDALVVTDYGEKLRNIDAYYDGNKEINRVHVTIFPDEIGLERLHARNRFLE